MESMDMFDNIDPTKFDLCFNDERFDGAEGQDGGDYKITMPRHLFLEVAKKVLNQQPNKK